MSEEEKYNDIEQLMYRELPPDRYCYIHNYIIDLKSQLQQKENIIKEIKENIKENWQGNYFVRYDDNVYKLCDETLEILDKENK